MSLLYEFMQFGDPGLGRLGDVIADWHYTDGEQPVAFNGNTYQPIGPIQADGMDLSSERLSGAFTIQTVRDFPIAMLFMRGYPARPIWVRIWNSDTGKSIKARVRSVNWTEAKATLNLAGPGDIIRREGLRIRYQGPCQWPLYGARCGVNRALHLVTGALDAAPSADGVTLVSSAFATKPNDFFTRGDFFCEGQSRTVASHVGNTITLLSAIDGLTAGTAFEASEGCDRSTGAQGCAKFGNQQFIGGCVNVPNKNPFEGLT